MIKLKDLLMEVAWTNKTLNMAALRRIPISAPIMKKVLGDIQAAMLVYLEHTALKITPGQALIIAIGAAYGPPIMALEIDRRKAPPLPPPKPKPKKAKK